MNNKVVVTYTIYNLSIKRIYQTELINIWEKYVNDDIRVYGVKKNSNGNLIKKTVNYITSIQ